MKNPLFTATLLSLIAEAQVNKASTKRYTAESIEGRRMTQAKGSMFLTPKQTPFVSDIDRWNAEVERKKQLKKLRKEERKKNDNIHS